MSTEVCTLDPDGDIFLILANQDEETKSDRTSMEVENDISRREIRVQCSSKHLTLASSVFTAMLSPNFKESATLRSVGTLNLPLPDDDPEALLILLNIIHGQTKEIPLAVNLYMLTQIAILVDKYRLQMVVGILSRFWISTLKLNMPQVWTEDDLRRWIFISWVFQSPAEFKFATKKAEMESESRIDESGEVDLPIPCSIIDLIDQQRQSALSGIIAALHSILVQYQGPDLTCTVKCDTLVLGSLTKAMQSLQILDPPKAPYSMLSFNSLAQRVRAIDILTDSEYHKRTNRSSCLNVSDPYDEPGGVKAAIDGSVRLLEAGLLGLNFATTGNE